MSSSFCSAFSNGKYVCIILRSNMSIIALLISELYINKNMLILFRLTFFKEIKIL